jgi:hypothetical protein
MRCDALAPRAPAAPPTPYGDSGSAGGKRSSVGFLPFSKVRFPSIPPVFTSRVLTAAAAACVALAVNSPPAGASHGQVTFVEAPGQLLDHHTRRLTMNKLRALGATALRVELHWRDVAPAAASAHRPRRDLSDPASYAWGEYDTVLREAASLRWNILLTVTGPAPRWATAARRDYITRPNDGDFEHFMTAVGYHYGALVSEYAIWNEPNIPGWLSPQFNADGTPASPGIYRALYEAGYAGLSAAVKKPKVLFGETSPFGHAGSTVAPLTFLRDALCLNSHYRKRRGCSELPMYGYAHHPYTYPKLQSPFYQPPNADDVTIGSLDRLTHALDAAGRAHAIPAGVPIYITEFGVESQPNSFGVSLSEQVEYEATCEKIAWNNARVKSFAQYLYRDELPHDGLRGYRTGMVSIAGALKPLYFSFPLPLTVTRSSAGYHLWGFVRAAHGKTRVRVLVSDGGGFRRLRSVTTDSLGYWTLHSSTSGTAWRVSWRSAKGRVYDGAPVGVT